MQLPLSFATAPPRGGIRLRVRAPLAHAGRLSQVTIGGAPWSDFDAAEETVNIGAKDITTKLISDGLPRIVVTFSGKEAATLRPAQFDPSQRVILDQFVHE